MVNDIRLLFFRYSLFFIQKRLGLKKIEEHIDIINLICLPKTSATAHCSVGMEVRL